jgi:hypothetical protein
MFDAPYVVSRARAYQTHWVDVKHARFDVRLRRDLG